MPPDRFRRLPLEVEAVRWTGHNFEDVIAFVSRFVSHAYVSRAEHDVPWHHDDAHRLVIWNVIEKAWLPVPVGWWVVHGIRGEFYPVADDGDCPLGHEPIPPFRYLHAPYSLRRHIEGDDPGVALCGVQGSKLNLSADVVERRPPCPACDRAILERRLPDDPHPASPA